jgi:hypothetical protein
MRTVSPKTLTPSWIILPFYTLSIISTNSHLSGKIQTDCISRKNKQKFDSPGYRGWGEYETPITKVGLSLDVFQ